MIEVESRQLTMSTFLMVGHDCVENIVDEKLEIKFGSYLVVWYAFARCASETMGATVIHFQ